MIVAENNESANPSIGAALDFSTHRLRNSETAHLDGEVLLAHLLDVDRAVLYRDKDRELTADEYRNFTKLVNARHEGRPVAQLTGTAEFWSIALEVNESVLLPRPETEHLVSQGLALLENRDTATVADLGTGSGAIAVAFAHERQRDFIVATDRSREALALARRNRDRYALENIQFLEADWLAPFTGRTFDLILSNPPYVHANDARLQETDIRHEPRAALAAGDDGLDAIRRIIRDAPRQLRAHGWLALEHGHTQGAAVRGLLRHSSFRHISSVCDLAGFQRVSFGQIE